MTCSNGAPARYLALSVGPAAAEVLAAGDPLLRVHSLFPSTMNLETEGNGGIVALSGRSGAGYPHAVVLADPGDFRGWQIPAGSPAWSSDGSLRMQGAAGWVVVDLSQAQRPPGRPLPLIRRTDGAYRACLARLVEIQARKGCDLSLELLLHGGQATTALGQELCGAALELGAASRVLRQSQRSTFADSPGPGQQDGQALESLRRAAAALIGLGAGLTPAGDDFLCGYLAAARAGGPGSVEAGGDLTGPLNGAVEANLGRTGRLSAALLRCAVRNFWPGPLVDLAEALAGEQEAAALRALDDLVLLGHSSGSELATGFLFGLEQYRERIAEQLGDPLAVLKRNHETVIRVLEAYLAPAEPSA